MSDLKIDCPQCGHNFALTESLAAPMLEASQRDFQATLAKRETAWKRQMAEAQAKTQQEALHTAEAQTAATVQKLRESLAQATTQSRAEVQALQNVLGEQSRKLQEAQQAQASAIRAQRELEEARRELDLTIEKRVSSELGDIQNRARADAEESMKFKVMEREETIASMSRTIEELKQKAVQGSQQLQGEAMEIELENVLGREFPHDTIEPVAKGIHGGDIIQKVYHGGVHCGTILWESKRTKAWSDSWLPKLRGDARGINAEVCIIVSQTLPKGIETFGLVDGVWVASMKCYMPVATLMRQSMIAVYTAKQFGEGQQTKAEMVYAYLTGPKFQSRIEAIVEAFATMREDLEKERRAITKQWAKREEQINSGMTATLGTFGDMQGIAGKAIGELPNVGLQLLE